ncbi:hypothetical protein [Flindersiella endophytica]
MTRKASPVPVERLRVVLPVLSGQMTMVEAARPRDHPGRPGLAILT